MKECCVAVRWFLWQSIADADMCADLLERERERDKERDRERESMRERGYDSQWRSINEA